MQMPQNCRQCKEQDRENLRKLPLIDEVLHDLHTWSEGEVTVKRFSEQPSDHQRVEATTSTSQQPQKPKVPEKEQGQQISPTKRRAKPTGKRTGGTPQPRKPARRKSFQAENKTNQRDNKTLKFPEKASSSSEEESSTTSENSTPSPKQLHAKKTATAAKINEPTRKLVTHGNPP